MANLPTSGQKIVVRTAAVAAGISPNTLWGVYGTESGFGKNEGPSSAGAIGPFQFLPSTAKSEGLTDPWDFSKSAYAAARYLKKLGADSNPNSSNTIRALNAYNGNGSGPRASSYSQQVSKYGGQYSLDDLVADPIPEQAANAATQGVSDVNTFAKKFAVIFDGGFWLRVGKIFLGFAAIIAGVVFIGREFASSQIADIAGKAIPHAA